MEDNKLKYNALLKELNQAQVQLKQHPEQREDIEKAIDKIKLEMRLVLSVIGDTTKEEVEKGFDLNKNTQPVVEKENKPVVQESTIPQQSPIDSFSDNWRMATQLAKSTIIPQTFIGKPENVIIALGLAQQMGLTPFIVMQNLNIIKGKISWSGSFCKTLIEMTGRFKDLELNYFGEKGKDNYGCYLSATRISDGKEIKGPEVTMQMAREEGWTSNKKWLTLTDLMLGYRCQSYFARLHCPEALGGIYTSEEITDTSNDEKRIVKDVL